jgi:hypothetical protein
MSTHLESFEDRLFSTIFFGSGLLFVATLFTSFAVTGGMIIAYREGPAAIFDSATYTLAHDFGYEIMYLCAVKMSAVFRYLLAHCDPHRFHRTLAMRLPCFCY